jgi:regulator of nonsense transcripts 1
MEFENFQYDSASSYGGLSVVDDTSSVYTAGTAQEQELPAALDALDLGATAEERAHAHVQEQQAIRRLEDELEGALDDLKDEGVVDLPPHACRYCLLPRLTYAPTRR